MEPIFDGLTKDLIFAFIQENQAKIKQFHVVELGLFGSFVFNTQKRDSDLDFVVVFKPGCETLRNYMGLKFFLEDKLNRKVDLVIKDSIKPLLKNEILNSVEYAEIN